MQKIKYNSLIASVLVAILSTCKTMKIDEKRFIDLFIMNFKKEVKR